MNEIDIIKNKIKAYENKLKHERLILKSIQETFNKRRDLKELQRTIREINKIEDTIANLNYELMKLEVKNE